MSVDHVAHPVALLAISDTLPRMRLPAVSGTRERIAARGSAGGTPVRRDRNRRPTWQSTILIRYRCSDRVGAWNNFGVSFELRHLRVFVAVADELHFGRAAARLHMTQPGVSQCLKQLEVLIGFSLFERSSRSVALTADGEALLGLARESVEKSAEVGMLASRIRGGVDGRFTVGMCLGGAGPLNALILDSFAAKHPRVELRAAEVEMADQHAALLDGRVDVLLHYGPAGHDELASQPLFSEPRVAVVPASSSLAKARRLQVSDVVDEPFRAFSEREPADLRDFATLSIERGGPPGYVGVAEKGTVLETLLNIARGGIDTTRASGAHLIAPFQSSVRAIPLTDARRAATIVSYPRAANHRLVEAFLGVAVKVSQQRIALVQGGSVTDLDVDHPL